MELKKQKQRLLNQATQDLFNDQHHTVVIAVRTQLSQD